MGKSCPASKEAGMNAVEETHAMGLATTHGDRTGIYKWYPDGRRLYTKLYNNNQKEISNLMASLIQHKAKGNGNG